MMMSGIIAFFCHLCLLLNLTTSFKSIRISPFSGKSTAPATYDEIKFPLSPLMAERLPWSNSVEPSRDLTYMDLLTTQLEIVRSLGLEEVPLDDKFTYKTSDKKVARMGNLCFKNDVFRKVRFSYFDAGNSVQVLNALWYPSFGYDSPLLGMDLISIGANRVMCVCDFQPLYPTLEYSSVHIDPLHRIREKYPDLHGTLSGKIYDDTSFFSKQMLFGRFTDESKVRPVVFPAVKEYLNAYISSVTRSAPNNDPAAMARVEARQRAYDVYSASKDPAIGLFEAYFGKEWADDFVHGFLFELSRDSSHTFTPSAVHNFKLNEAGDVVISPSTVRQPAPTSIDSRSSIKPSPVSASV